MVKVLIWQVSPDMRFKDKAIKILEQQHDGIEIVGEVSTEDIARVYWGGIIFSLSSAQGKLA